MLFEPTDEFLIPFICIVLSSTTYGVFVVRCDSSLYTFFFLSLETSLVQMASELKVEKKMGILM